MQRSRIRLGIVGCGRVAEERHLPALRALPQFEVAAVADVDGTRADRMAPMFGAKARFCDYRDMLRIPEIDAVAVLTPTGSHAEIGAAALEAGKHVFMEKPLALATGECDRLIGVQRRSGRVALVCFNLRWHRLVRRARAKIAAGELGRIKLIRSVYTHDRTGENAPAWHRKLALGGGVSFNEGVHHFDLWRYLLGTEVERVFSTSNPSAKYEDETNAISATLASGVLATGVFSFLSGPNSEVEIYGDKGRLYLSCYRFDGLEFYSAATYPGELLHRVRLLGSAFADAPAIVRAIRQGGDFAATFHGIWRHFGECVHGLARPECTLLDGKRSLEIALASGRSAATGLPVLLLAASGAPAGG
jgi:predicted dehydrogenase